MKPIPKIESGILCGGQATRMGGVDKGLQEFAGTPMCAHVIALLAPYSDSILISANRNLDEYGRLGFGVYKDEIGHYSGPLAGIYTLLKHCSTEYLLLCPCDTPKLTKEYPERMLGELAKLSSSDYPILVATVEDQLQPLHILVSRQALQSIEDALNDGVLSVKRWLYGRTFNSVDFSDVKESFTNFNYLKDLP